MFLYHCNLIRLIFNWFIFAFLTSGAINGLKYILFSGIFTASKNWEVFPINSLVVTSNDNTEMVNLLSLILFVCLFFVSSIIFTRKGKKSNSTSEKFSYQKKFFKVMFARKYIFSIHFVVHPLLSKQHVLDWNIWTDGCNVSKSPGNKDAWRQPLSSPTKKIPPSKPKMSCVHKHVLLSVSSDCMT